MKLTHLSLLLIPFTAAAAQLPPGIALSIELQNAREGALTIVPHDSPKVLLRFSNHAKAPVRLRIHDFDPYHKKLPYPVDCAVRITDDSGRMHPFAKENGEWWSQFNGWATLFDKDDDHNYRIVQPGEELVYEVALADVLTVPFGGTPAGWAFDRKNGFRAGSYIFEFRYGDITSDRFALKVQESDGNTPNQPPEPIPPTRGGSP